MSLWPLALGPLASVLIASSVMVLMVKAQRPNIVAKSPHHRWNEQIDLINEKRRLPTSR